MEYYNYKEYFETLITNTNTIISQQENLIDITSVVCFGLFLIFIYIFIRNMIKGRG